MLSTVNLEHTMVHKYFYADYVRYMGMSAADRERLKKMERALVMDKLKDDQKAIKLAEKLAMKYTKHPKSIPEEKLSDVKLSLLNLTLPKLRQDSSEIIPRNPSMFLCGQEQDQERERLMRAEQTQIWGHRHCHTGHQLLTMMKFISNQLKAAGEGFRKVRSALVYEDPKLETQGLAQVGGKLWLVTFALQHLVDLNDSKQNLKPWVIKYSEMYHEIAHSSQQLVNLTDTLFIAYTLIRENITRVTCHILLELEMDSHDFLGRSDNQAFRVFLKNQVSLEHGSEGIIGDDYKLKISFNDYNVVYKDEENTYWDSLTTLDADKRHLIIYKFGASVVTTLDEVMSDLKYYEAFTEKLTTNATEGEDKLISVNLKDLSSHLCKFVKLIPPHELRMEGSNDDWQIILEDLWDLTDAYGDSLHEMALMSREICDISRICYNYTAGFYNFDMPEFSEFKHSPTIPEQGISCLSCFGMCCSKKKPDYEAHLHSWTEFCQSVYQDAAKSHKIAASASRLEFLKLIDDLNELGGEYEWNGERKEKIYIRPPVDKKPAQRPILKVSRRSILRRLDRILGADREIIDEEQEEMIPFDPKFQYGSEQIDSIGSNPPSLINQPRVDPKPAIAKSSILLQALSSTPSETGD